MAETGKQISNMIRATESHEDDLLLLTQPDATSDTGYISRAGSVATVADEMLNGIQYATELQTPNKTVLGAINDAYNHGGGNVIDDDRVSTSTTYSSSKIESKNTVVDGKLDNLHRSVSALWKLEKGQIYDYEEISSFGDVTVPSGAMAFASLQKLGGMSRKGKNLSPKKSGKTTSTGAMNYTTNGSFGEVIKGETYTLSFENLTSSTAYSQFRIYESISTSSSYTNQVSKSFVANKLNKLTFTAVASGFLAINNSLGSEYASQTVIDNIQLELGSSATDYEPYTDTLIDAPVDKVVSVGKNLFDILDFGNHYETSGTSIVGRYPVYVGNGKQVTLSSDLNLISGNATVFFLSEKDGSVSTNSNGVWNTQPRTITSDTDYVWVCLYFSSSNPWQIVYQDLISQGAKIQLEYGNTPTEYVPYMKYEKPISQSIIDLCPDYGIGVNESVYNYIDFETKTYHRRVGSVDLGSLTWEYAGGYMRTSRLSDMFNGDALLNPTEINFKTTTSFLRFSTTTYTDPVAFKEMMNGVMLYYELATEGIIDLSAVWTTDLDIIDVESNGTISFDYPNKETYKVDVPNTIEYLVRLSEVN